MGSDSLTRPTAHLPERAITWRQLPWEGRELTGDLGVLVPPDDSGGDTFARYRYQVFLAVPWCLDCALGGRTKCIIPEHLEDLAIEDTDGWHLIQIKTRNLERGPWKLSDLLAEGGGLHSLARSYKAIPDHQCTYELWLEGPFKPGDSIEKLCTPEGRTDQDIIQQIRTKFNLSAEQAATFLTRIRLYPDQPSRSNVISRNIRFLALHAPDLAHRQIEAIHKALVERIETAMAGESLGDDWPVAIIAPGSLGDPVKAKISAKRLTLDILAPLISPMTASPKPLLKRFLDRDLGQTTTLEQKLLAGGATEGIIRDAKSLRANAAIVEVELASRNLLPQDDVLEDVRQRLGIRVEALRSSHERDERPAIEMWRGLIGLLSGQVATIDARGIFSQDPDLLLGEICQMADLCITDWGVARA